MTSAETVPVPPSTKGWRDKHQAILDAAAAMFGEQGYERASVDAIAERAGVSKPTIYSHFGTKEQLFRDSIAEAAAQIKEETMAAVLALDVRPDRWRPALFDVAFKLATCQRSECSQALQRQIHAEIKRDPGLYQAIRSRAADPMFEALAGRLAMLANAGYLRIDDPVLAAKQFLALSSAELADLTLLGTYCASDADVERAVRAGVDTFLAAFEPRSA
jgi:AcrR family transcriptional regulator